MDQTDSGGGGGFSDILSTLITTAGSVFSATAGAQANAQAAQATAALAAEQQNAATASRDSQIRFIAIGGFVLIALFVLIRQTKAA